MAKTPVFKYNLRDLVEDLTGREREFLIPLLEAAGIPHRTFYNDRAILVSEQSDIPGGRLLIYSKVFSCELASLFNYKAKADSIASKVSKIKTPLS